MGDVDEQAPAARSRAWIGRAAFEAGLIVLGLVGALLVDEWRTARERTARVQSALASIRSELEANRTAIADALANHQTVITKLREATGTGGIYQGSLISSPGFSAVAWDAARDGAITNDIDHVTLVALGHAYTALSDYMDERRLFTNYLYTNPTDDFRRTPQGIAGWLNDMSGHAKRVERRLDAALQTLPPP
jgi:hypothetical protein